MPITRTALIDDDGTGTTGTVLNNAWYQAFCDAIDALAVNPTSPPVARTDVSNTFTVSSQWISASVPRLFLKDTGSAADARLFDIMNSGQLFSVHALNDAVSIIQATPLQLSRAGDAYIGRDLYEKARTTPMGHWIDIAFNAANFGASTGSWTVAAQSAFAYSLVGKMLWLTLQILTSTITGTPGNLVVQLPAGFTIARPSTSNALLQVAGAFENGFVQAASGSSISVFRRDLTAFPAGTTRVDFTIPIFLT